MLSNAIKLSNDIGLQHYSCKKCSINTHCLGSKWCSLIICLGSVKYQCTLSKIKVMLPDIRLVSVKYQGILPRIKVRLPDILPRNREVSVHTVLDESDVPWHSVRDPCCISAHCLESKWCSLTFCLRLV